MFGGILGVLSLSVHVHSQNSHCEPQSCEWTIVTTSCTILHHALGQPTCKSQYYLLKIALSTMNQKLNNFCYVNLMFQRKGSWSFHFRARMRQGENLTSTTQVHIIIILYVHARQSYIRVCRTVVDSLWSGLINSTWVVVLISTYTCLRGV